MESPRRRKIEGGARVSFLGTPPKDESNRMQNESSRVYGRGLVGSTVLLVPIYIESGTE